MFVRLAALCFRNELNQGILCMLSQLVPTEVQCIIV